MWVDRSGARIASGSHDSGSGGALVFSASEPERIVLAATISASAVSASCSWSALRAPLPTPPTLGAPRASRQPMPGDYHHFPSPSLPIATTSDRAQRVSATPARRYAPLGDRENLAVDVAS